MLLKLLLLLLRRDHALLKVWIKLGGGGGVGGEKRSFGFCATRAVGTRSLVLVAATASADRRTAATRKKQLVRVSQNKINNGRHPNRR
jgi:hypothetical protein